MIAYVFWHWPAAVVGREAYEERLVAFHHALGAAPPPGFHGSRVLAIDGAPWAPGSAYEDWYLVDGFAALGALNEAAVSASRKAPHDAVARVAAGGAGGVYRKLKAGAVAEVAHWFSKAPGERDAALLARLPEAEAWQRQLVLGPAPEFCVFGPAPAGVEPVAVRARVLYDGTAGATEDAPPDDGPLRLEPIGVVRSSLTDVPTAPMQGDEGAPDATIELGASFTEGLQGIRVGDEVIVVTWLHQARRDVLQVHPRSDESRPLAGVFATRSPDRPNPLGLHRVTVLELAGATLRVGPLEVIDGTPVVDLKPVLQPSFDG